MFKKNIAKLLVFAMILSMLPFSAVTAGAARTTRNTASNDGYALIKDSTAYVTGKDASAKLKLTAPDNNKGAGTTTSPYVLMNDSGYVVVKDTDNRKTVNVSFEVENADSVYYLGTDAITSLADADKASLSGGKSVNQEITITASLSATTGTPVTAFFAAYSLEKDATYYKLTFSARAEDVKSDEYTVTFDAQGGNFASGVSNTAKANKANNYKVTLPTAPTKDNAKFEGWFTQPEGNGEPFTAEYTVTSDMTVYANWSLKTVTNEYKVNVDTMEHGTVTPNPTTAVEGAAVTLTVEPEQTYRLKADTLLVYKVAKDTLNISDTTPIKPTYSDNAYTFTMPDSDVIITAEFELAETKRTVTLNVEGPGSVSFAVNGETVEPDSNGTYSFEPDTEVTVNVNRPIGYDLEISAIGAIDWTEVKKNETYTFVMPDSNLTVTSTFKKREIPETARITWTAAENFLEGELAVDGTIEGKWYVFQLDYSGASAFVAIEGNESGRITIPCVTGYSLTLTEAVDLSDEAVSNGNFLSFGDTTSESMEVVYTRSEEELDWDSIYGIQTLAAQDTTVGSMFNQRAISETAVTTWTAAENFLEGELAVEGTIEGKWYVFQLDYSGASAFVAVEGNESNRITIPCVTGYALTLTEAVDLSDGEVSNGNFLSFGDTTEEGMEVVYTRSEEELNGGN